MLLLISLHLKLVSVSAILILLKVWLGEVIFDRIESRGIVVGIRRWDHSIDITSPVIILLLGPIICVYCEFELRLIC